MTEPNAQPRARQRSLFALLGDVPTLVSDLVRSEFELLKAEIVGKLKLAGVGAGLILIAAVILLLFLGVLLTAAIFALSLVMPGWLAALLVALVLLIIIAILAFIGYREIKKAMPPTPTETIDSVKRDYFAIRGIVARNAPNRQPASTRTRYGSTPAETEPR
ncbi:phage holin family protein [Salinibacterium sp. ZJ450]|uniref:phage holin family protein n=1 Tax=Salinibacterium sp. ZJ450 TaxID=2708338 RepID=UPI0014246EA6|nr:phage holin family protein [Salinibacterium sp. ZJ450]